MQSGNFLNINLAQAAKHAEGLEIQLTNRFFADLEQEEISGGEVRANILVHALAGNIYNIKISLDGAVTVPCDRCLDPLDIDIHSTETVKVKDDEEDEGDSPDLRYTETGSACYDLSWDIYEIIVTSLPIQRIHEDGKCDPDVLSYITGKDGFSERTADDHWDK